MLRQDLPGTPRTPRTQMRRRTRIPRPRTSHLRGCWRCWWCWWWWGKTKKSSGGRGARGVVVVLEQASAPGVRGGVPGQRKGRARAVPLSDVRKVAAADVRGPAPGDVARVGRRGRRRHDGGPDLLPAVDPRRRPLRRRLRLQQPEPPRPPRDRRQLPRLPGRRPPFPRLRQQPAKASDDETKTTLPFAFPSHLPHEETPAPRRGIHHPPLRTLHPPLRQPRSPLRPPRPPPPPQNYTGGAPRARPRQHGITYGELARRPRRLRPPRRHHRPPPLFLTLTFEVRKGEAVSGESYLRRIYILSSVFDIILWMLDCKL
mmetsp:Transcript_8547/g.28007  ORF Transcript_8547/g.28007 Transcript_8547/m.28007 type:complete len:316 (+) Transcript_8547:619-1566(+)